MKHRNVMRRFAASALALTLALGISATPAFAAGNGDTGSTPAVTSDVREDRLPASVDVSASGTNTIRITSAARDAKYELYRLLSLETSQPEGGARTYRYSFDPAIGAAVESVVKQFGVNDAGYGFQINGGNVVFMMPEGAAEYKDNAVVKAMMVEFADALRVSVEGKTSGLTPVAAAQAAKEGENLTVAFNKVEDGYYMVASNAGARSLVYTVPGEGGQELSVAEKNVAPGIDKKVWDSDDVANHDEDSASDDPITGSWQESNDAAIGDVVSYRILVDLYKGSENIVVHDTLSEGLTLDKDSIEVYFEPRTDADNRGREVYQLDCGHDHDADGSERCRTSRLKLTSNEYTATADGSGFKLVFENSFTNPAEKDRYENPLNNVFLGSLDTLEDDGGQLEIRYDAVLNDKAVIGGEGNTNKAHVGYGHVPGVNPGDDPVDPPHDTPDEETKTYTYEFSIDKYVAGDKDTKLEGAKFQLIPAYLDMYGEDFDWNSVVSEDGSTLTVPADVYNQYEVEAAMDLVLDKDGDGNAFYRPWVKGADADDSKVENGEMVTDADGKIAIRGLDSKLYAIKETEAPSGYIELDKPAMVAIGNVFTKNNGSVYTEKTEGSPDADGNRVFTKQAQTVVGIENASGIRMPETGGIGTTIFYVCGGLLAVAAAGAVVLKKKKDGAAE